MDDLNIKFEEYGREEVINFVGFVYNCINPKYWNMLINDLKRFLEIVPKDLIQKIEFYAKFR